MNDTPTDTGWKLLNEEDASCERVIDHGDFDGALIHTARVLLGGNDRWTAIYMRHAKGRHDRRCQYLSAKRRIAPKLLHHEMPPQFTKFDDAKLWCEKRLQKEQSAATLP